jgi:Zn finger protein HypA/HybF involved in hydrogenase expression
MINNAPKLAINNRTTLNLSTLCGCYHCAEIYNPSEITEWTDNNQTAICPKCKVDAVIAQSESVDLSKDLLEKLQQYWF